MNVILLSGGSGKRLWPLSNEHRSKQFLKLIQNDEGQYESMVQRVYRQILEVDEEAQIVITTGKSQESSIKNQLGEKVEICVEPKRRDTFPAIALTSTFLALQKGYSKDDVVVVCPVDPFTEEGYFKNLKKLEQIILEDKADIALMGVKTTYPSAKYGYIIPGDTYEGIKKVSAFKEKPTEETARGLIEQGGLWNCGVCAFKLGYILDKLTQYITFSTYEDVYNQYEKLPKISFDYEVLEKEEACVVIEFDGIWKDLGTWNTLTEEMQQATYGNVILGSKCKDINVINELDIPILVMGAQHMVICASSDGIIVSDKQESSYIKPYVDTIQQRVMYEEKSWGSFNIINMETDAEGRESLTIKLKMNPGKSFSYHTHTKRNETWMFTAGQGEVILNDAKIAVKTGDTIHIKAGDKHMLKAYTELSLIEVQVGGVIDDSDILKIEG